MVTLLQKRYTDPGEGAAMSDQASEKVEKLAIRKKAQEIEVVSIGTEETQRRFN